MADITIKRDLFLERLDVQLAEALATRDSRETGSTAWHLWEWRLDALQGIHTMLLSGRFDA